MDQIKKWDLELKLALDTRKESSANKQLNKVTNLLEKTFEQLEFTIINKSSQLNKDKETYNLNILYRLNELKFEEAILQTLISIGSIGGPWDVHSPILYDTEQHLSGSIYKSDKKHFRLSGIIGATFLLIYKENNN